MPFADFWSDGGYWMLVPITALMIPIVALLLYHQQKMAQIIHGRMANPQLENEVLALRQEVQQLQYQMSQQTALIERMQTGSPVSVGPPPSLRDSARLS